MMRSKDWIRITRIASVFLTFLLAINSVVGQTDDGNADLDKALDTKLNADSTKDLDAVVRLCESALEKGLDDEGAKQAKQLAAASLYEHADQLGQRIFASGAQDKRWKIFRSQALTRLDKAVEFQPDLAEAYLLSGRLNALPGGDRDIALAKIEKAMELIGDDAKQKSEALLYRATLAEDDESRMADLNESLKVDPKNEQAARLRAEIYLREGDTGKAVDDLRLWLSADKTNIGSRVATVQRLMQLGDKFDEGLQQSAGEIIDEAIEIEPDNALPYMVRAALNQIREKPEQAIADANHAVDIDPKNIDALILRSRIYVDQKLFKDALADVNRVLEIEPTLDSAILQRIDIRLQMGDYAAAIEDVKMLAEQDRTNEMLQRQLANLYNADDQPEKAIPIYNRLLRAYSDGIWKDRPAIEQIVLMARRSEALRGRGDARLSTGEHAKAVEDFKEALELGKSIQKLQEAEGMENVIELDDGILNNLAWVLATSTSEEVRDGKLAIEFAKQAAEQTEYKEAHILSTLASGYAETGDFDTAIEWINKAIELNKAAGEKGDDKARTDAQWESLHKELESYKKKEAWRENQRLDRENAEKEKAEKEKAETDKAGADKAEADKAEADKAKSDSDKSDSDKSDSDKSDDKSNSDKSDTDKSDGDKSDGDKSENKDSGKAKSVGA